MKYYIKDGNWRFDLGRGVSLEHEDRFLVSVKIIHLFDVVVRNYNKHAPQLFNISNVGHRFWGRFTAWYEP